MTVSADNPKQSKAFTPARLVALALVAVAVGGLAWIRFAPGDARVSVPAGAHAGELTLKPCSYDTERGRSAADCGTLVVPENRADARSRLIALPVTRIRARSAHPAEPVFRLEGGPGLTNMRFAKASRFADRHDVVLVGYRGVDGSVRLDCPEVTSALKHSTGFLGAKSERAYADAFRACATRLRADGVDLAGYGIVQQVDDLDAARKALGYGRVDLLSESAGTRAAMIYAWRYPRSVHRSVMIGVNPPGHFLWDGKAIDEQIGRYAKLCSRDAGCSRRTGDLAASIRRTAADIPDHWWFLPIDRGNVRLATFFGLMESTPEAAPLSAPMTLDSWLDAAKGDASGFWFMSLAGALAYPESFVWGEYAAFGMQDARFADAYFGGGHDRGSILGNPGTDFVWGGGRLAQAWPANAADRAYGRVRTSRVETLLIGGALDGSTPATFATRELLPHLPNGHQVVLPGIGHSTSFWAEQPDAGTRLVTRFLASGRVDTSLYRPARVDFTPSVGQGGIAKIVLGAMLGLAALTVLSLLWLPLRVRVRGGFGRKGGAILRTLYPVVLGLGGWFVAALVLLTTNPGIPLDDELLACLAAGAPIGLGVYYGWVRRDWSASTKTVGLAAAAGGALVGAWLGFDAVGGLTALFTAIAGAAAGANLLLLALDLAWDRQGRDRFAPAVANEMPAARTELA